MGNAARPLATTRPWRVLVVALLAFAAATVLGAPVAGLLNNDADSFADRGSTSALAVERIEAATGVAATPALLVLADTANTPALFAAARVAAADPAVAHLVGGPDAGAPFLSEDGGKTYFAVLYHAGADFAAANHRLAPALAAVDGVTVGGPGAVFEEINQTVARDLLRAELVAFPLLFAAALWVFRSAVAALLPLAVGALTIALALVVLRAVNEAVEISTFALNLITGLGLGLSIDYSLFMVSRFREELARAPGDTRAAVARTVATAGRTVAYSAATVAGAGLALLVFPLRFLYSMGVGVTVVALLSAAVALVVLPALLAVLGPRVNALAPAAWQRSRERDEQAGADGGWYRLAHAVMRRPATVALAAAALMLALGAPFLHVKFTGVDAGALPEGSPARAVVETLRADFPHTGVHSVLAAVTAPADAGPQVARFADAVADVPGVRAVAPPRHLGGNLWQVDIASAHPALDEGTLEVVERVRALDTDLHVLVGGLAATQVDQQAAIAAALPAALAVLCALTFLALFLMTGSVVLPLKALAMNLLTVSATFGILVLVFQDGLLGLGGVGALESTQPVFLFAIAFGLSTDYAVFLLTRIKEARDNGADDREAVALGLARTGRIVTAAAVLFAIAVGAFATSQIVFVQQIGVGTAAAVLIDATIVRALLVPSLMALLGRANWWAPAPLRRLHRKVGLREGGGPATAGAGAGPAGSVAPPLMARA